MRDKRSSEFEIYLRTGRRATPHAQETEKKFNPWHDRQDGRFTFAGRGQFFGPGSRSQSGRLDFAKPPSRDRLRRLTSPPAADTAPNNDPRRELANPRNAPIYIVEAGDSLSRIAASRRGLSVSDLAWLNGIPVHGVLRIGQTIKVPTQAWLDANQAKVAAQIENIARLEFYRNTQGNTLPVPLGADDPTFRHLDVTKMPSIPWQIEHYLKTIEIDGTIYKIDIHGRVFKAAFVLRPDAQLGATPRRSRRAQADAGGGDRLPTDDGGHYRAVSLDGSSDPINHFAQDAGINRGQYRVLEQRWAKAQAAGKTVSVEIYPRYDGSSRRPYKIDIIWSVDGQENSTSIENYRKKRN